MAKVAAIRETATETAKKIRKALKKEFPGFPARHFSVRKRQGTDHLTIKWAGKPDRKAVELLADKFKSASFYSVDDSTHYHGYTYEEDGLLYVGAGFISISHVEVDDEPGVTQEDLNAELAKAPEPEKVTVSNLDGDLIGDMTLDELTVYASKAWRTKFNEEVEIRASLNGDDFMLVAGFGTSKKAVVNRLKIGLKTMDILRALGLSVEYGDKSDVPRIGGFKGNWSGVDFTPNGIHYLPDAIIVKKDGNVLHNFFDVNAFSSWLGEEADKGFKTTGIKVETSVIKGKMVMRSAGGSEEIRTKLAEQGIIDDNGVKMVNGMLHELGYRAQLAGALYGVRGSGGKKVKVKDYKNEYEDAVRAAYGLAVPNPTTLPGLIRYPFVDSVIKNAAFENKKYKEEFSKEYQKTGEANMTTARNAVVTAIAMLDEEAKKTVKEVVKREVLKLQKAHEKKGIDVTAFYSSLGTSEQTLRGVLEVQKSNHAKLQKTVEEFVKTKFSEYLKELETKKEDPNQVFTDKEIAEADVVKVTRADINMIRTNIDHVVNQKTFEGYVVSRGELMKLIQMPVVEGLKEVNVDDYREFEKAIIDLLNLLVKDNFEKFDEMLNHPDPRDIKSRDMIRVLREKVVRVVFRKRDGSIRTMYATRNKDLIEKVMAVKSPKTYKPSPEVDAWEEKDKIEAQIAGDYIRVLDIAKAEFRTFKPSSLQRFDSEVNVSAWLEFDISDDAWFDMIFNGRSAHQFYANHRNAKNMGGKLKERQEFEKKAYMIINGITEGEAEAAATAVKEDKSKLAAKFALEYLKSIKGKDYGDGFEKVRTALRTLPSGINKLGKIQEKGYVAKIEQEDKESGFMMLSVGKEKLFVHPHFLVNATSGKVYADKSDTFRLGHANPSDIDLRAGAMLERAGELIQGERRQLRRNASATDADVKRMNRLKQFIELHPDTFKEAGVQARVGDKDGVAIVEFSFSGGIVRGNPSMLVMKPRTGEAYPIFKRVRHTSTSSELTEALNNVGYPKHNAVLTKQFGFIRDVLFTTFDLRKQIN